MPKSLTRYPEWYQAGDKEPIEAGDLNQVTLKEGTEVTVWSRQCANDEILMHGHGSHLDSVAEAYVGLDVVASGNGALNAGDNINGKVVLAITNSDGTRVLADTTFDSLSQLRAALAQDRTERIIEELLTPYAKPGRNLEIRVRATSASDGAEVDPAASSGTMYYTQVDA